MEEVTNLSNGMNNFTANDDFSSPLKIYIRFYMYIVIVVGLCGNTLSILVFLTTQLSQVPSSHYLTALAISDIINLIGVVIAIFAPNYVYSIPFFCPILIYVSNTFSFLSVWYVVAFTVERFIAVCYPLRRLTWCTVSRARKTIVALALVPVIFNGYVLIMVTDADKACAMDPSYEVVYNVMNILDSLLTLVIPISLIVFLNLRITHHMMHMLNKQRKESKVKQSVTTQQRVSFQSASSSNSTKLAQFYAKCNRKWNPLSQEKGERVDSSSSMTKSSAKRLSHSARNELYRGRQIKNSTAAVLWKEEKVTQMLLVVSVVFVVMNLPDHVMRAAAQSHLHLASMITNVIFQSNYSVNFFLYNIVGVNFRRNLRRMLKQGFMKLKGKTYFQLNRTCSDSDKTNRSSKTTTLRNSSSAARKTPAIGDVRVGTNSFNLIKADTQKHQLKSVEECCCLLPMGQSCDKQEVELFANPTSRSKHFKVLMVSKEQSKR